MKKLVVVMGGPSTEAEVSRRSGTAILNALKSKGYNAEGLELDPVNFPQQIKESGAEFVFNALHGKFGEDGILQGTLDMMGIPYTGSGVLAAAATMDKIHTKRLFESAGISTPKFKNYFRHESKRRDLYSEILAEFNLPLVVKASSQGSSIGVVIVETQGELEKALSEAFKYDNEIMVEEFIRGRELTVAVWGDDSQKEAFPIIEITTTTGRYDYETKYKAGASTHIIPAPIEPEIEKAVKEDAIKAFSVCGCRGIARIDFMLSWSGKPYAIEVNTVPGMTETSLVPDAGRAIGLEFPDLCEKILLMAGYEK